MEHIFQKLNWNEDWGININGSYLTNLRFADDVVLFSKTPGELQTMLEQLHEQSKKAGLTLNKTKTKLMSNGPQTAILIDGETLAYVNEYTYLGQLISFQDKMEKELRRRICLAWKAFWGLKFILLDRKISRKIKFHTLETCVYPVLLYGCQTWSLRSQQKNKLQICQRKMQRKILGISLRDRIPNTTIQQLAQTTDVAQTATQSKWKWGGHIARLQDNRWTYKSTVWDTRIGQRTQGRPRRRWEDIFKDHAGHQWTRIARDREEWKSLGRQLSND